MNRPWRCRACSLAHSVLPTPQLVCGGLRAMSKRSSSTGVTLSRTQQFAVTMTPSYRSPTSSLIPLEFRSRVEIRRRLMAADHSDEFHQLRLCVDRMLTPNQVVEAARLEVRENPSNIPPPPRFSPGLGVSETPSPFSLAAITGKKWAIGRTLRVRFLAGESAVQAKVQHFAERW